MRPCLLVLACACSTEREQPRAAPPRVEGRASIDVRVTGAPLSIRGVELEPVSRSPGVMQLGYRVEAKDKSLQVPARIMCRVSGYNIVYPSGGEGKVPGPRLAALYRADPFSEVASACEVTFRLADKPIASVCWREGALTDGACAAGTFTPPPKATEFPVEIVRASLELRHGTALVSGLFTVYEPLPHERRFVTQIRCEDDHGAATGEGELAFLPLDELSAGMSMYGPVAIFLDRTPAPTAACEVRLVSRAMTGAPTERLHARYCMTTGAVRAGDCAKKSL